MSCSYLKSSALTLFAFSIEPAEICPGKKTPSSLVLLRSVLHAHTPAPCALHLTSSKTYYGQLLIWDIKYWLGVVCLYVGNTWASVFGLAAEQVHE